MDNKTQKKQKLDKWLDQDPSETLLRWHTTGWRHVNPLLDDQVQTIGSKLAQACLLKVNEEPAGAQIFWESYPFMNHALSESGAFERLRILDQALSDPEFEGWLVQNATEDHKDQAMHAWLHTSRPHRTDTCERVNLAKWITGIWSSRVSEKELFSAESLDDFLSISPGGPNTREVILGVVSGYRRSALMKELPSHPRRKPTCGPHF